MIAVIETWTRNVPALKKEPSFHKNKTTIAFPMLANLRSIHDLLAQSLVQDDYGLGKLVVRTFYSTASSMIPAHNSVSLQKLIYSCTKNQLMILLTGISLRIKYQNDIRIEDRQVGTGWQVYMKYHHTSSLELQVPWIQN